jgi:subtilisin family serine protease
MNARGFTDRCNKAKNALCIALVCSMFALFVPQGIAQINGPLFHQASPPSQFIVRDSAGSAGINLTCLLLGCQVLRGIGDPDGQLFVVQAPRMLGSGAFLAVLLSANGVSDAELDQTVNTLAATMGTMPSYATDETPVSYYGATVWEGYLLQTPNQIVRTAETQSAFGVSGSGATVALIDTGVDPNNAVLKSQLVDGYDFTRNTNGGSEMGDITQSTAGVVDGSQSGALNQSTAGVVDGPSQPATLNQSTAGVVDQSTAGVIDQAKYSAFGHGTMTAGIVHLVAPSAWLMPLKAFNANGTGYASDVLRAIYYAVNHRAKIISMSFEFTSPSLELANAINYATTKNLICVGSAGNDGSMTIVYPSGLPNVIDVASTSNTNTPSSFSNYGTPPVWLSAPGEGVMTTYPFGTYAVGWGTSFSAPFVSGTVALMVDVAPWSSYFLNQTTAAQALSHAQPIPETQYGFGVLDTYQAVQAWKLSLDLDVSLYCSTDSCQTSLSVQ